MNEDFMINKNKFLPI